MLTPAGVADRSAISSTRNSHLRRVRASAALYSLGNVGLFDKLLGRPARRPAEIYTTLRAHALTVTRAALNLAEDSASPIHGVVMDTGTREGVATLVCLLDGSVSLYTSTGGGTIGGGQHDSVRRACTELLAMTNQYAQDFIAACRPTSVHPLPGSREVFFHLLTTQGVYSARCREEALIRQQDPFSALFSHCHHVIAALRETQEKHEKE